MGLTSFHGLTPFRIEISKVKGGNTVGVKEVGEKYRCSICGNEVTVTKAGGGTLVCCGKDMEKIG